MSFSQEVKSELNRRIPRARHCKIAELTAIMVFLGKYDLNDRDRIEIVTENVSLAKKVVSLLKKCYQANVNTEINKSAVLAKNRVYHVTVSGKEQVEPILEELRLSVQDFVNPEIVAKPCCQKAFIRGAFLATGSVNDPGKSYHLEIVCHDRSHAEKLEKLISANYVEAKITARKNKFIVYIKDSTQIADFLGIVEATNSLMELENIKILKGIRNSANRQYNCDAANINKIVNAASKQLDDIRYIQTHGGFEQLPKGLQEIAEARLEHPELSLLDLGAILDPPVGKSGVNHRLRKLADIAEELRGQDSE